MTVSREQAARDLIALEGWLLDRQDWDSWLGLYLEDAEYWIPCWKAENTPTADPTREVSLIYYSSRTGLEDRVFRIRTGRSLASTPLPRTGHLVTPAQTVEQDDGDIRIDSSWATHSYKLEQQHCFFGTQTHVLRDTAAGLRILKRKILVMNDKIPNVLDIYSV